MNKQEIREKLKKLRDNLSEDRRKEASKALFHGLIDSLCSSEHILSFSTFQSEIDTTLLNHYLARTGRLYLPKMVEDRLEIYHISDLNDLIPNSFGLYEPDPLICKKASPQVLEVVLVPALGFNKKHFRIGYGKGCYDRFLEQIPHCKTIGIGFKEQLTEKFPVEKTDHALSAVSLF